MKATWLYVGVLLTSHGLVLAQPSGFQWSACAWLAAGFLCLSVSQKWGDTE